MRDFLQFLFSKTYRHEEVVDSISDVDLEVVLNRAILDARYYESHFNKEALVQKIQQNGNELPVFLYRLGQHLYSKDLHHEALARIHWLMRECCGCEIFYSAVIDAGFRVVHGLGTVIGPRHRIGKGFQIYQGCTIGGKKDHQAGCVIGSNVIMYAGSQILGDVAIGDNVIIGSHSLVLENIPSNTVCYGIPARPKSAK
jgi:serine O-acetyltransferase